MSYGLKFFAVLSCLFLALPTFVRAQETGEKELKILFIGNSYTFFNSLDKTVGDMLTVSGIPTKTSRSLPGGWSFERHFKGEVPNNYKGEPTPKMIKKEKWDYVVLQEQSAAAVNNHTKFMEFGKKLVDMIHENCPETKIVFYQTWGRCDGMFEGYGDDEARKSEVVAAWTKRYSAPDEATLAQLKVGMQGSYEELRKATDSALAPVGKAFFTVGDKLDLHCDEGDQKPHHPNPRGSYLAGCVFFKTITGQSPVGLWKKLVDADKAPGVEENDAEYLEKIADEVVK